MGLIKFVLKIYKIIPKNIHRLHSTFQISLTKYPRFVRLSKVQYIIFLKKIRNLKKKAKIPPSTYQSGWLTYSIPKRIIGNIFVTHSYFSTIDWDQDNWMNPTTYYITRKQIFYLLDREKVWSKTREKITQDGLPSWTWKQWPKPKPSQNDCILLLFKINTPG